MGAGAVGGYFGGLLALAGAPVVMIGRQSFVDAVQTNGLFLDTRDFQKRVPIEASTELNAVSGADLVLFCVKTTDTVATAQKLSAVLAPHAIVVSLQNGVDNVELIRAAINRDTLAAAVYVAASVPEPGCVKHVARGDLVIGPQCAQADAVAATFQRAQIGCRISDNIEGELWTKLILNCALNAISALAQARYDRIIADFDGWNLVEAVVEEVFAVAQAAHITLPAFKDAETAIAGALKVAQEMSYARSSTAQDISRGRRTEIYSLNGYISKRGAELGVPTPINRALFTLVKMLESRDLN